MTRDDWYERRDRVTDALRRYLPESEALAAGHALVVELAGDPPRPDPPDATIAPGIRVRVTGREIETKITRPLSATEAGRLADALARASRYVIEHAD